VITFSCSSREVRALGRSSTVLHIASFPVPAGLEAMCFMGHCCDAWHRLYCAAHSIALSTHAPIESSSRGVRSGQFATVSGRTGTGCNGICAAHEAKARAAISKNGVLTDLMGGLLNDGLLGRL